MMRSSLLAHIHECYIVWTMTLFHDTVKRYLTGLPRTHAHRQITGFKSLGAKKPH